MRIIHSRRLLIVCTVLLMLLVSANATAALAAQQSSAQSFISYLEQKNIKYTYEGVNDNGIERIRLSYRLDHFDSLDCILLFQDNDEVDLRVWNIVTSSAGKEKTVDLVNRLNAAYKYVKFVYDESDSTVQGEVDMLIDAEHSAPQIYSAINLMLSVIDEPEIAEQLHALE